MILNDESLFEWASQGGVTPFESKNINPASIDLCWSGRWRKENYSWWNRITNQKNKTTPYWSKERESEKIILKRGAFYLLDTLEYIHMPRDCGAWLALKSSSGRMGLEHLHAGYVDPGFRGTLTLELENRAAWPIILEYGQRIMQLVLHRCETPKRDYSHTGRYNGQIGPMPNK